jgi:hypothetical protein
MKAAIHRKHTQLAIKDLKGKGKAIPLKVWTDPEGSMRLMLPDIKTIYTHEGGEFVSPSHQPSLPPRKYSWYSFLVEADSTPGP